MSKNILLIDDEANILRALRRLLTDNGYAVFTANSGQEALVILSKEKINVVISDQRMPTMTGSELLLQVKKKYPETVRMILSAYADFDAIKDAINEGSIYKFLTKPWNDELLVKDVADAFAEYQNQQKAIKNEKTVFDLMYQDNLTGLCNRFSFSQHLFSALAKAKHNGLKLALIYIDLDHFDAINSLGFEKCDKVLQEVARRLSRWVSDKHYIARLNNSQFAIIHLDFSSLSVVENFLTELMVDLNKPLLIDDITLFITASLGVSSYPQNTDQPDFLKKQGNLALLHSKELGGNNIQFFQPSLNRPVEEQLTMETELHAALAENQFVVYYQPLVSITTQKIIGAEALLRWQHPTRGLVPPDLFLPLCEKTGLIIDIGTWVLRTVCNQIKKWNGMGYIDLCVAVNLSQKQFNHAGLLNLIKDVIKTSGIASKNLEIEITESMMMQNVVGNIELLKSLRDLGLKLALDDFGTGYSSLSYLKQFPFNILKIDKSFVNDIATDKESEAILAAIITMAKSLELTLIAEGVETQAQLDILKEKKCDIMQGYLFSKPVPADDFTQLMKTNTR